TGPNLGWLESNQTEEPHELAHSVVRGTWRILHQPSCALPRTATVIRRGKADRGTGQQGGGCRGRQRKSGSCGVPRARKGVVVRRRLRICVCTRWDRCP